MDSLLAIMAVTSSALAAACPGETPEAAAAGFTEAARAQDFAGLVRCTSPGDKAVLAMLLFSQAGAATGVL
ncbi:MAG: hypothetical protein AAGE01_20620 [Pseudomonadota bacterium]